MATRYSAYKIPASPKVFQPARRVKGIEPISDGTVTRRQERHLVDNSKGNQCELPSKDNLMMDAVIRIDKEV